MTRALEYDYIPPVSELAPHIGEHSFEDPAAFVDALRPRATLWGPEPRNWIFRGLADADWKLWPSAHRNEPWAPFRQHCTIPYSPGFASELERQLVESRLLREFCEAANASGLPLPIETLTDEDWRMVEHQDWPNHKFVSLLALAQHYRVPTRLLDWTRRGIVAAYFAAQEPVDGSRPPKLCVWALNRSFVDDHGVQDGIRCHVRVCSAPHASNPNLHAQAGLFTFNSYDKSSRQLHAVESVISDLASNAQARLGGVPIVMRKLTLPREHARTVLRDLDDEDVSARTLFPDFAGVVEYLRYRKPVG